MVLIDKFAIEKNCLAEDDPFPNEPSMSHSPVWHMDIKSASFAL